MLTSVARHAAARGAVRALTAAAPPLASGGPSLKESDPELHAIISREEARQRRGVSGSALG